VPWGDLYLGGFLSYCRGSNDFLDGGNGHIDAMSLGAYTTLIHPSGFYADLVVKETYMWTYFPTPTIGEVFPSLTQITHCRLLARRLSLAKSATIHESSPSQPANHQLLPKAASTWRFRVIPRMSDQVTIGVASKPRLSVPLTTNSCIISDGYAPPLAKMLCLKRTGRSLSIAL
jgi:hypothetical protein